MRTSIWALVGSLLAVSGSASGEERLHRDGTVLIQVPAATFTMGSDQGAADQRPAHKVSLSAYWIGRCEVSNAQFERYLRESGQAPPLLWQELAERWGGAAPALGLSHQDASGYCRWAGLRLLSEAEWEHAARPAQGLFPWGKVFAAERCWSSVAALVEEPHSVDGMETGKSWCGCLHLAGNAWEWTDSWYQAYPGSRLKKREFGAKFKVLRGGSWQYRSSEFLQVTYRTWNLTVARLPHYGFRVALDG